MADETIVTNIVATSNFSGLISDVNRVAASLSNLQRQLVTTDKTFANQVAKINAAFASTLNTSGMFSTHFVSLSSDAEKFGRSLESGRLKLRDYFGTLNNHAKTSGGLIRDLAKQQVQLQNAIVQPMGKNAQGLMQYNIHVARGLDEIANKTAIAQQQAAIMNKVIQQGANQLINWGKNTQWAGRQLTVGLTVPLVAFGKAAADAFRTADQELVRLTKVYGDIAGTSASELGRVRKEVAQTAAELSKAYGASYTETLGLAADIAATGQQGEQLIASTKETTRLAILGEVDRQEAMKATLSIQTAFKQNTEQLTESINFLNAVENQTSTSLADLVEAIPKAGPVIKGLGGSVKDLALYLTAMREGGISASEGANALKSGLASLINPTNVAVAKFESFGIDLLGIVNSNAGNVTQTLFDLQAALDKLDPLQKQQAIEQLFGKFQFSRMNALFENLGKQGSQTLQVLDLMKASTGELATVADRELKAVTESASGRFRRAIEGLRADLAEAGDTFLDIGTKLINIISKIIRFVEGLPSPLKKVLTYFAGFTAVAGPLIMLTGVLGNFFGYIVKGVGHFRALFKGAEGWKLLTPEILAANQAGNLVEQTFYSDARAATVLKTALSNLVAEFESLRVAAATGVVPVAPMLSTMTGGTVVPAFGQREVDPRNPLAGQMGTRASAHMVPRNVQQPGTFLGMVPSSIPVNQLVGENPMIYAGGDLPNIPGLTNIQRTANIGGKRQPVNVSTGIVAGEASKWHAMNVTLAMMSKTELAELRASVAATGVATKTFMDNFDDIFPAVSTLVNKTTAESAQIVAEVNAGKMEIAAARRRIIELNLALERELGVTATGMATERGRTVNLTNVPMIDQAAVDPTGKSNMRQMFRGENKSFLQKLGGLLGIRTSGAGYNIGTTRPKRFNKGSLVPGTGNSDTVPALLTPGEFVVNAKATKENLPLLQAMNQNGSNGPRFEGGSKNPVRLQRGHVSSDLSAFLMYMDEDTNQRMRQGVIWKNYDGITGAEIAQNFRSLQSRSGVHPMSVLESLAYQMGGNPADLDPFYENLLKDLETKNASTVFGGTNGRSFESYVDPKLKSLQNIVLEDGSNLHDVLRDVKTQRNSRGKSIGLTLRGKKYGGSNVLPVSESRRLPRQTKGIGRAFLGTTGGFKGSGWRMILSRGLRLGFNQGGMVPQVQYFEGGGGPVSNVYGAPPRTQFIPMSDIGGLSSTVRAPMIPQGMSMKSMMGFNMASMVGSLGGGMAGQAVGGPVGGMAGSIAGSLIPGLIQAKTAAMGLGTVLRSFTLPGLVITGLLAIGKLSLDLKKKFEDLGKANRLAFGGTQESFASVGIKNYKSLSDRIKDINEQMELHKAQVRSTYESYTKAGPTGLTLTIKELREQIKYAKTEQKDYVNAFNSLKTDEVVRYATNLKAQFVAMGMSAEDATNQIYAIVKASNKSGEALDVVSNKSFKSIVNAKTGIESLVKNLSSTLNEDFNVEEFNQGLDTLVNSTIAFKDSLVGTKDAFGNIITQTDAIEATLGKIRNMAGSTKELTTGQLNELKKQNLVYANILGQTESLESITAKVLLYQEGLAEMVDLAKMGADEAFTFAQNLKIVQDGIDAMTEDTSKGAINTLSPLTAAWKKATDQANAAITAVKTLKKIDEDAIQQRIKNIQKIIDKIDEERDARLKLLDVQQKSADFETNLKQAQIKYKEALAAGNMAQAAQEQLNIQKLTEDRQRELARQQINDKADNEIKKYQDQIDKLREQLDALKKSKDIATQRSAATQANAAEVKGYIDRIEAIARNSRGGALTETQQNELSNIFKEMSDSTNQAVKDAAKELKKQSEVGTMTPTAKGPVTTKTWEQNLIDKFNIDLGVRNKGNEVFAGAVKAFDAAVKKFAGETGGTGSGTMKDPLKIGYVQPESKGRSLFNAPNLDKEGNLTARGMTDVIAINKLKKGQYFTHNGKLYRVDYGYDLAFKPLGSAVKDATVITKAAGGYISGPGSSTSDSIPAMLSNGEYVINAAAVSRYGAGTFDQYNTMKIPGAKMGGMVSPKYDIPKMSTGRLKFYEGGMASTNNALYNIDVTLNGTNLSPDDVARAIEQRMKAREVMNGIPRTYAGSR